MTLLPNRVGRMAKTSSFKQMILRMHSICSSFKDFQPSQNGPAAGSTNRLLWEFDCLLAIRKCIIFTNNKEKRKKKKKRKEHFLSA
jgi:hypothetical protein